VKYLVFLFGLMFSCEQTSLPDLPDPEEAGWNGEKVCKVIEDSDEMRILRCTFAPGVGHEKHYHKPHVGYTVQGSRFKIVSADEVREVDVPTGYTFSNDQVSVHEIINVGDSTGVFLIIEPK